MLYNTKVTLSSFEKVIVCCAIDGVLTSILVVPFSISSLNFYEKPCTIVLDLFASLIHKETLLVVREAEDME